jgi:DNA-binding transcriptional LysR family regulator
MKQVDLADLEALAAVAEARSFRAAAAARGTSASTLSEAVRRLEIRLGVRLLNRTTRSVTATDAGAQLLARLAPALSEMRSALDTVNSFRDSPTGVLRLNVPEVAARLILPPIVTGFLKTHPGITVDITVDNTFIDVVAKGFDAGIRYEERLDKDMIAVPIGPRMQRFAIAAAPSYLEAHGRPKHPRDLLQHACIRYRFSSGVAPPWELEHNGRVIRINPTGPLIAGSMELKISAAEAGLGIMASFEEWLAPSMASGALEPVLKDWWQSFSGPFLYYSSRRYMPTPLRAFVDYIKSTSGKPARVARGG